MKKGAFLILILSTFVFKVNEGLGQTQMLDTGFHHYRNAEPREWSEFPAEAEQKKLLLDFTSQANKAAYTLSLRQYDVKQNWQVSLNGQSLGSLIADEKDMINYYEIPPGMLRPDNTLEISCGEQQPDDIRLGEIALHNRPLKNLLSDGHIAVEVFDAESREFLPSRITITNGEGILQTVSASSTDPLAIRTGCVYTGNGKALLGLPAGAYTIYAGRGFEYGIDSARVIIRQGDHLSHQFFIAHQVQTTGWASSDTHIHTFTWSKHGDASVAERALTIAGEGLELPVMTDHNVHVDLKPAAVEQGVDRYFTPVVGNEVTTGVGHFNVFPVADEAVINHRASNWKTLSQSMPTADNSKAIILNHARDIHLGFRPFDPKKHLSSAGLRLDDWEFPANAMEVINSGSQQTDQMELTRDWFGMLNHGNFITPAGSSDSHDVSRFIVGQARTYIRCDDEDPADIDISEAVGNFVEGNVMICFGLLAEIEINDSYGPGELVSFANEVKVSVKVSGPSWIRAERVTLYANGKKIREAEIENQRAAGVKWEGTWTLTMPAQDIFLVALADGPVDDLPYWPVAKPFQPASPDWKPGVMGLSGAVWLDGDQNGKRDAAFHYAGELIRQVGSDFDLLVQNLALYDEAVSIQVAALLHKRGKSLTGTEITKGLSKASPQTKTGFQVVIDELRLQLE